ncbi:MAG: 1-deoxy-D-xylulose-5-phosphate reductoisomerase [Verrucomicrobium sp.]|nr:1-deoxy-D-xylulose-5-phosphate reductoisomerase [Verrucomicrobium sp.]
MRKKVILLGSTGSIGLSALKVARDLPERMEIVGLAAGTQGKALLEQAREFKPRGVALFDTKGLADLKAGLPAGTACYGGAEGLVELVEKTEADMVLVSIVGTEGLHPALAAIEKGRALAVASKEILVMAGEIVTAAAKRKNVPLLPVDSEHNAIFQCLHGESPKHVRRLILTASGGPFRKTSKEDLAKVTLEQALKHPTWQMGRKITLDSATLFNKGLEMIEARWLFDVPMSQVDVVVHPQSIVHSLVEFVDGSQLAQLSHSDMCFPIQYAVTYPDRLPNNLKPLDLAKVGQLLFEAPDADRFPSINLARRAGETCGTLPSVFNAANEVAVQAFIDGAIRFDEIATCVGAVMDDHAVIHQPDLDAILSADAWARRAAADWAEVTV